MNHILPENSGPTIDFLYCNYAWVGVPLRQCQKAVSRPVCRLGCGSAQFVAQAARLESCSSKSGCLAAAASDSWVCSMHIALYVGKLQLTCRATRVWLACRMPEKHAKYWLRHRILATAGSNPQPSRSHCRCNKSHRTRLFLTACMTTDTRTAYFVLSNDPPPAVSVMQQSWQRESLVAMMHQGPNARLPCHHKVFS